MIKKIELLAPARDLTSGMAAVDYGADAVYIGASKFGARKEAGNSIEDVTRLVDYARPFGVKIYAALNTIIYEKELEEARKLAIQLTRAGVDALIIQDMSFLRLGLGDVEFHASTQTTNTTPEKIRFLEQSGFSRVILERGLTLDQIKEIRRETKVDLEFFVHGSVCVGYSGQCYLSRSMGTRSGNRGECAQPCRLPYDLINERQEVLSRNKHLLSVKDLNLSSHIDDLLDAGITSFKIEGRLKDVNYIKNLVSYYRELIDKTLARRDKMQRSSFGSSNPDFVPDPSKTFSREVSSWMIKGKSPGVADLDSPKPKGEYIGVVGVPGKEHFIMQESVSSLSAGDGICYYDGKELKGAGINKVLGDKIYLNKNVILKKGWKIYRNYDHKFFKILEQDRVRRKLGISILAELSMNNVAIEVVTESGFLFKLNYPGRYNKSQNSAKTEEAVKTQFRKSGNTIFLVTNVEVVSENEEEIPFLTIADLNNMRRESFDKLLGYLVEHENKKAGKKDLPAENMDFPFPSPNIKGDANVVNSLARKFYADHEVKSIEEGFDTRDKTHGLTVMTSSYCIRREMDLCLKNHKARLHKELYLRHGKYKYLLDFDCKNCNMKLINITSDDRP